MQASSDQTFAASYDTTTKVVTVLVCAVLLGMLLFIHNWIVIAVAVAIIGLSYAWSPQNYEVSGRTLLIHRLIGDVKQPLHAIGEIRRATGADFQGCIKLAGSGGMFGYYGLYRTSTLGKASWFLTDRSKAIVLRTGGRTVLVSPDDTDNFLASVQAQFDAAIGDAAAAHRAPMFSELPSADAAPWGLGGLLVGGLIGFAALTLVAAALLYAPGPTPYTLTSKSLTIHDRFYSVTLPAASVDVDHVRVVDISADRDWRPVARTNGFANSHYRSGWFRVANGTKVRLYAADGTQLVLFPPKGSGAPVLLETPDPNEFVRQLRNTWAQ